MRESGIEGLRSTLTLSPASSAARAPAKHRQDANATLGVAAQSPVRWRAGAVVGARKRS